MMRAAIVESWTDGGIRFGQVQTPRPGPDEVLVAVHTAPISFADVLLATGNYQVKPQLPFVPGAECAGVVEEVGANVQGFRPGDRVLAIGFRGNSRSEAQLLGTFAEKIIARPANLAHAPDGMPLETASLFRGNYETAYHGLEVGRLKAGETLLVLGAGGGTGFAAVTTGKAMGAFVIASAARETRRALAREAGADVVIDTSADDWREQVNTITQGRGVDCIYDPVGGDLTERAFRTLAWNGRHVVIGFAAGTIPRLPTNLPLLKGASLIGSNLLRCQEMTPDTAAAQRTAVMQLLVDGALKLPPIVATYELEQIAEAIDAVRNFEDAGRIVLSIDRTCDNGKNGRGGPA